MKRLTSIFLVLAMLLALAPMTIFASDAEKAVFSDVKDTDYYAQAVAALEQLDILTGYPDGTFGAEKPISRAEMAAIVCRMIDKEANVEKKKGETIFDDVRSHHWASGYINIASEEGIINGDGNGKFHPEDDVKHEEAIKMVVCALGYGDDVEVHPEDWSKGYLEVADEKGISDDLKGTKGKASTRGDVAVMSYNGLSADLATPTTSLKAGSYRGTKTVKLETSTEGAEIYYTTDGSTPTVKSTKYTNAISISKTCTLKAITVKDGVLASDVLSVEYIIKHSSGGSKVSAPSEHTVSFDLNYEGAIGTPESQIVNTGEKATEPEEPIRQEHAFIGWFENDDSDTKFDFTTTGITTNITLKAKWIDLTDTTDTDSDGITDSLESYYKTNILNVDTDNDGLTDFDEIVIINLDPLKIDSDENGINDGDEDYDLDGLSNSYENINNTSLILADSDEDGLSDKEEIQTYSTNPTNKDSDDDGVSDGKEIELGTDPNLAQTTFSMNVFADDDSEGTTASVQMNLSGEQVETLSIQSVENDTFFPENMPGYMGKAYDFNVEGEFDNAVISFEFDNSELTPNSDPVIYYFNEEMQELVALETTVNGNVASAEVTHFSKYILVDRTIYEESFEWIDVWDSSKNYTGVEIILVIDDSGSMTSNDKSNQRLDVAKNMVDKLPQNCKIGIVQFESDTTILTPNLTDDKETAKSYLTTSYFKSSGGTYMYRAINDAFSLYESTDESVMKVMVVLTDGATSGTSSHSSTIAAANSNDIKIYTVGLGNSTSYFNSYLKPLASNTQAAFYLASNANQLEEIYNNIGQKIDIETDSDNDGIPDYYEDNLVICSGVKLILDKNNPDTDGDGLLDGEEVTLKYEYNEDNTKVIVTGKISSKPDDLNRYITIPKEISKNNIKEEKDLTMREWHPLIGLSQTMMELDDNAETLVNTPLSVEVFQFVTSWINNSQEITRLKVTTSKNNEMTIKYGTSIEVNRSGKQMPLSDMIIEKYYNYSPSIIFTADKKADEYIRSWFGLSGSGKYSMVFDFGKVYIGDYGYYLIIEENEVYQVPIIHEDTTMKVYYKDGKENKYLFDAAHILRHTKIKLSDEEKSKVLEQLRNNGYTFN